MIVLAPSLTITPADASIPPGTPLIGWHNVVNESNVNTTTTYQSLAQFAASQMANPSTNLRWKGDVNTGNEIIEVNTATGLLELDYLAVAGHNFGTIGSTLRVLGSNDGGSTFFDLTSDQILADDTPVIFVFDPQPLDSVHLRIGPGSDFPTAAVLYVGKLLVMERGVKVDVDHVPLNYGRSGKIYSGFSEQGNFLGRVLLQQHRESKAEFAHITPSWYRSYFDQFIRVSRTTPFFWAWNPSEYPYETGYAWLMNDPVPATNPVTRRVSVTLEMRGFGSSG